MTYRLYQAYQMYQTYQLVQMLPPQRSLAYILVDLFFVKLPIDYFVFILRVLHAEQESKNGEMFSDFTLRVPKEVVMIICRNLFTDTLFLYLCSQNIH